MAGKTVTIDLERVNATFRNAVPVYADKLAAKEAKQLHPEAVNLLAKGFLGIPGTGGIDAGIQTACKAWPGIRKMFNMALRVYGWWPSSDKALIAQGKAWLEMTDKELVPFLCQADDAA